MQGVSVLDDHLVATHVIQSGLIASLVVVVVGIPQFVVVEGRPIIKAGESVIILYLWPTNSLAVTHRLIG